MTFLAYIFPSRHSSKARLRLDDCNVSEPGNIYNGPHLGKMFLDAGLAERDPRWIPLLKPLISDPANEVQLVELTIQEIIPPLLP